MFRLQQMVRVVILGLVPRIQRSTNASAGGWVDGRDKLDHDNAGQNTGVEAVSSAIA
jgi:hypothetical protein